MIVAPAVVHRTMATPRHQSVYLSVRHRVQKRFGRRAPGRNIVKQGLPSGHLSSDRLVVRSTHILERMLHPVHNTVTATTAVSPMVSTSTPTAPAPDSSLESCIVSHESSGDSQAVNGDHEGYGQWNQAAWDEDGGTAYAPTPLQATPAQQLQVLASEGTAGMEQQQAQFDGC